MPLINDRLLPTGFPDAAQTFKNLLMLVSLWQHYTQISNNIHLFVLDNLCHKQQPTTTPTSDWATAESNSSQSFSYCCNEPPQMDGCLACSDPSTWTVWSCLLRLLPQRKLRRATTLYFMQSHQCFYFLLRASQAILPTPIGTLG